MRERRSPSPTERPYGGGNQMREDAGHQGLRNQGEERQLYGGQSGVQPPRSSFKNYQRGEANQ